MHPIHLLVLCRLVVAASVRETHEFDRVNLTTEALAGSPDAINKLDLFNIHDMLIVGYYAPMTEGPHLRCRQNQRFGRPWPEEEDSYEGLQEARKGAVTLAKILHVLHPVPKCRKSFAQNLRRATSDEALVVKQAATAWECVGVQKDDVIPCGSDGQTCKKTQEAVVPLTTVRHHGTTKLIDWNEMDTYRNIELKQGHLLGACYQPKGKSGPKRNGESDDDFKERISGRKTAWLRACTFWTAFHALALRADALAATVPAVPALETLPNKLFGSIVRIVAGGALFCGG